MNLFVAGGAGFIGSNFIIHTLEKYPNYKIFCFDLLTYAGKLSHLEKVLNSKNFKFYQGSILDKNHLVEIIKSNNIDVIVNFAAESHVDNSISSPEIFIDTNIKGTQVLLDVARELNIKKFHQVSTDEVYGDLPIQDKSLKFTEKSNLKPSSPYAASKASADLLCMSYFRTFNLSVTITRCSNNYGLNQHSEKLIPNIINKLINNEKPKVYGSGTNVRDWIHVLDHCDAILEVIHKAKSGTIYNVGANNELSNLELINIVLQLFSKSSNFIDFVPDRPGHDLRYSIDSSLIYKDLGWVAIRDFSIELQNLIDSEKLRFHEK